MPLVIGFISNSKRGETAPISKAIAKKTKIPTSQNYLRNAPIFQDHRLTIYEVYLQESALSLSLVCRWHLLSHQRRLTHDATDGKSSKHLVYPV